MVVVWLKAGLAVGRRDRRVPDVLPGHDQHAARPPVGRAARARADRSYAASRWQVLWQLRVPASLPYLFSALKISATASVVGAIIGELPSSIQGGLGGAILNFNQYYSISPEPVGDEPDRGRARHHLLPRGRARGEARRAPRAGARGMSVVEIKGLTKTFPKGNVTALQGIDLQIEPGEFVSLIGPSGCGKSTLLRLIGDLTPPSAGTVEVNGKSAHQARARPRLRHGLPGLGALRLAHRREERRSAARDARLGPRETQAARRRDAAASSSCRASATTTRGSSPAACRCASRSRARSRSSRRSC